MSRSSSLFSQEVGDLERGTAVADLEIPVPRDVSLCRASHALLKRRFPVCEGSNRDMLGVFGALRPEEKLGTIDEAP